MKNTLFAAAAAAALFVSAPAFAQDASNIDWYGNLGYSFYDTDIGDAQLGAVQGRIGARFHPNFGIEGEAAFGVQDDDVAGVNVELDHSVAIYGVGFLPVSDNFDLLARVGYGSTKVSAGSFSDSDDSLNYGVGAQWSWDQSNAIRGDYTRFDGDSAEADVWSVSYVRKF
ncbi:MAG: porin family protein [Caulobacteraceae bacterium]|nr:porin family protein [Caulobacteraceae bacterium]